MTIGYYNLLLENSANEYDFLQLHYITTCGNYLWINAFFFNSNHFAIMVPSTYDASISFTLGILICIVKYAEYFSYHAGSPLIVLKNNKKLWVLRHCAHCKYFSNIFFFATKFRFFANFPDYFQKKSLIILVIFRKDGKKIKICTITLKECLWKLFENRL